MANIVKRWLVWKVLLAIGIAGMLYFAAITAYTGYVSAFNFVWIVGGVLFAVLYRFRTAAAIFIDNLHKSIKVVFILLMTGFAASFVVVERLIMADANSKNADNPHYIIILGGGIKHGKASLLTRSRINTGAEYLKQDTAISVVICGGVLPPEKIAEAQVIAKMLQQCGIAQNRICMEDSSKNTHQNLLYARKCVDINKKVVIITSEFHLYRAKRIAEKAGYKNIGGIASPTPLLLMPTCCVREYLAVVKDFVCSNI